MPAVRRVERLAECDSEREPGERRLPERRRQEREAARDDDVGERAEQRREQQRRDQPAHEERVGEDSGSVPRGRESGDPVVERVIAVIA